ncbi:MAG TPA: PQQ-dependent sugar dehydrogenase, partial [Flavisolibacter sp.]|nr:PQQ-dependent sugar dehydrogenase [Flavisolibacter sp.]
DRIWALGLRNPFRWSFDRANGNMWIGDVGQGAKEEINFRTAATSAKVNYGWRCYEGYISTPGVPDCTPADYVPPVYDYDNPVSGPSSVVGGFVYRGTEYAAFRGYYIAADVYSGSVFLLWPNGSGGFDSSVQTGLQNFIVGFGEAEDGTLYTVSQSNGTIYKVVATGGTPLPVTLESFSAKAFTGYNELNWKTSFEQGTAIFRVEYSTHNSIFQKIGEVAATRSSNGSNYTFRHQLNLSGDGFYRLAIEDDNGSVRYSPVVKLSAKSGGIKIYPTIVRNGLLTIDIAQALQKAQVINTSGSVVFEKDLRQLSGTTTIPLPRLARGVYVVQVVGEGVMKRERIVVE